MDRKTIKHLRDKAEKIAKNIVPPIFYLEKAKEVERSRSIALSSQNIQFAKSLIENKGDVLGHGFLHASKVALDAGAIIYSEVGFNSRGDRLAENSIIAGYLHDVKRDESDHPEKAARYVESVLKDRLGSNDLSMIKFSIRNHEAFKKHEIVNDEDFMIIANTLYDADKFRWGPDNFIYTIWDMAESMSISPETIFKNYKKGIKGIIKIKKSFRTNTGKEYGPDFIDKGLEIGEQLFRYCMEEMFFDQM